MAHRYIITAAITGTRAITRSFIAAYKQASASSQYQKYQAKNANGNSSSTSPLSSNGLTLEEACKILNVAPPQGGKANMEEIMARFKKLFDNNDPKKGGSFYLQSKILRARQRLEAEVRKAEEKQALQDEVKEGWKPKVYKDR